jgi:hypothetical protein
MFEFSEFYCPYRARVIAAVPLRLALLVHGVGMLALLFLEP